MKNLITGNLDHISVEKVLVTPDLAKVLLEKMHSNRSLSKAAVELLTELLGEGSFYGEISPVFFDDAGKPRDGQHRFQAVIDSGVSAWMLFVHGVTEEAAEYIDTGRKRTYADQLRMRGLPDYKRRSVVSKMLAMYDKYGVQGIRNPGQLVLTPREQDAWVEAPGMEEAIRMGESIGRAVHTNPSYLAYALFRTADGELDGDGFWNAVGTGENLKAGDPALSLRNQLLLGKGSAVRLSHAGVGTKVDPRLMTLYLITTAWNRHVLGESWTRPQPRYEVKNGARFFPASSVPDFLSPASVKKDRDALQQAYGSVQGTAGGADDAEEGETAQ